MLPIHHIGHNIDSSSSVDVYFRDRLPINHTCNKQSLEMLPLIIGGFLKNSHHWIKCQLSYPIRETNFLIITRGCKKFHWQHEYHIDICRWSFPLAVQLLPFFRLRRAFFPIQIFLTFPLHPPPLCSCQTFRTPSRKFHLTNWLIVDFL